MARPSDAKWQSRSGSTLAQVMAHFLMAPSQYLNQCSLIISEVLWPSTEGDRVSQEILKISILDIKKITRYFDGTLRSEVTPVTIWYIHPPHQGYSHVTVMVMNDRLTSLLFHLNQPTHSSNNAISKFDLETTRSMSCVRSKVKVT